MMSCAPVGRRTVSDERIAHLVRKTLETKPQDGAHWNVRQIAGETRLAKSTASHLARVRLEPHRQWHFKLSNDPFFVEKVRDIVGLYLNPPENAVVLCVDEKARSRRWNARSPCCHWVWAMSRALRMTTGVMSAPVFARYWGFRPRPCRPYRAQSKGKIESGVKYVRRNFVCGLLGREPSCLMDFNTELRQWVEGVANQRVHGTTREQVLARWDMDQFNMQLLNGRSPYPTRTTSCARWRGMPM
jgi:hypothetical protein